MSGIKITHALDITGVRVDAETYGTFPIKPPLTCPSKNCNAYVAQVNGYKRESYGKQQFIPAFFRLEKGFNHSIGCQFSASGQQTIIAKDSDFEVKEALAKGELEFRIHVMDPDDREKLKHKTGQFQITPPNNTTEKKYRTKGRASTYVRSMNSLLDIYNHGIKNYKDRNKIILIINGNKVKWTDFFYSTNHLGSLRTRLANNSYVQAAVIVKVKMIGVPNRNLGNFQFIECYPKTTGRGKEIYMTIKLTKRMSASNFTPSKRIMLLSKFCIPQKKDKVTPEYLGNEIRTLVSHAHQIVEF